MFWNIVVTHLLSVRCIIHLRLQLTNVPFLDKSSVPTREKEAVWHACIQTNGASCAGRRTGTT